MAYYASPRWSTEFLDCSLPVSLDTYSACSYRCIYCFSFFQKALGRSRSKCMSGQVDAVSPERIKKMFSDPSSSQFGPYLAAGKAIQWGGLADEFDEYERKYGKTLELLKFFRARKQPISFSTKGTWWTKDERYLELFRGADHWHVKISIITLDEAKAKKVEIGVDSPEERLQAIGRLAKLGLHGVTLRLRPFILGISSPRHRELIARAADMGADSVSTEFLCMEVRSTLAKARYEAISKVAGVDLLKLYREKSAGSGYLRLNREIKEPFMLEMAEECEKRGLRFYVSDAHFKEMSANGCCCGAGPSFPYSRHHFLEALLKAKQNGRVTVGELDPDLRLMEHIKYGYAHGMNTKSAEERAKYANLNLRTWLQYKWNDPNGHNSPYRYFGGVLEPAGRDADGNVVYKYKGKP